MVCKQLKVLIIFVIVVLFGLLIRAMFFNTGTGEVEQIGEVPHVGKVLQIFKVNGPVRYRYFVSHRGDTSVWLIGQTSKENFDNFVKIGNGRVWLPEKEEISWWLENFKNTRTKGFYKDVDLYTGQHIRSNIEIDKVRHVEIDFNVTTGIFTAIVSINYGLR